MIQGMRIGLAAKYSLFLLGVTVVVFVVLIAVIESSQRKSIQSFQNAAGEALQQSSAKQVALMRAEEEVKVTQLGKLLAKIAPNAIAVFDIGLLEQYAAMAIQDPDILGVRFKDANGQDVAVAGEFEGPAGLVAMRFDILDDGDKVGVVHLAYTMDRIQDLRANARATQETLRARLFASSEGFIASSTVTLIVIGVVTAFALAMMTILLFRVLLGVPLREIRENMIRLAEGDLETPIFGVDRKDEIGEMAKAVLVFKENGLRLESHGATASHVAAGIANASAEIAASTKDLSLRTERNLSNLETSASALSELSMTVSNSAENADVISRRAATANDLAEQGRSIITGAVEAMSEIENSSNRIRQIVSVIDEIAFQTNLLSLNAAVEAARAGDVGKGFAVVASEVGKLARRSSDAAKEVKDLIEAAMTVVGQGVELVNKSGGAFEEISTTIDELAGLVSNMADATREQAMGLKEISSGMSRIETMVNENAALVEQNTSATESLKKQANSLTHAMTPKH